MFHLALFSQSIAVAATVTQVSGLADPVVAPSGSGLLVPPVINKVMRMAGQGNLLNFARMTSASLRDYAPFDINPTNVGTSIGSPARCLHFEDNPIPLATNEELDAFCSNSGVGATQTTIAVWFCDGPVRPVSGRVFTVRWTGTTTLVANAWSSVVITLDNGIPSGTFAIVGSRMQGATPQFHRWIPRGGPAYRPGSFAQVGLGDYGLDRDRYGLMGEWMRFTNTTPPTCEIFALAADTAQTGFMDLIQVG